MSDNEAASSEPAPAKKLSGPIAWMAKNSVAANLMMLVAIIGGLMAAFSLKQEVFPEFELDYVNVTVPFPGASPKEVEQGILLSIEEAVRGIDGVKRVNSVAAEGIGTVVVELLIGTNASKVQTDIKNEIDRIQTFPEEAEEPTVAIASRKRAVISLIFSGDYDMTTLHEIGERARAELLQSPDITQVELFGIRPREIAIEVPREKMEAYGLTLQEIAAQVRAASVELPGGGIDTKGGELLVRVADRRLSGKAFNDIVLRGTAQGHQIRLGDIATITDGYEETDQASYLNGKPAVRVTAYRVGDETPTDVSNAVKEYAEKAKHQFPAGTNIATWNDDSELLRGRIDLLVRNGLQGGILVLLTLALFLQRRLAGWVAIGIPVSFLGAFLLLQPASVSINMVSLFALIVTLGMVVDDAIVVSENIHTKTQEGMGRLQAAILGAREMAVPVTFSILTTVAAFSPLFFAPGMMGKIMGIIPLVVIAVLFLSLLESFFVLPSHLGHGGEGRPWPIWRPIDAVQARVSRWLESVIAGPYRSLVERLLVWRYAVVAFGTASLVVCIAAVISGFVPFSFFPKLEGDIVTATARLPYGSAVERTEAVGDVLMGAADKAIEQYGRDKVRGVFTEIGQGPRGRGPSSGPPAQGSHLITIEVALVPTDQRQFSSFQFAQAWKEKLPPLPGVETLSVSSSGGPSAGSPVDIQLTHRDPNVLAQASNYLTQKLREFPSLTDVDNTYAGGKPQLDFKLREHEARNLGLTSTDIARALRSSFFGAEALREQRGRDELKVRVRLPREQRTSEFDLDKLTVGTPQGGFVPLLQVADFERGRAPTAITREEGKRTVNVSADLVPGTPSPRPMLESIESAEIPELMQRFPGLEWRFVGQERERQESFSSLGMNFLFALFVIFALLAVPFKSYIQPVIVMSAIPFGILGAVLGHVLMGYELSFISALGIIALSGVVVNDSLVLVDAVNRYRREGMSAYDAVIRGGMRRFRPILLTSLTTFFGLMPMIFETSRQARFLIPMAISLGFGVLFVTFIVLLLVPALYLIVEDARARMGRISNWLARLYGLDSSKPDESPAE